MDYEKKYKEALERARQFSEKPYLEDSKGIVDYIFPELKESKGEKIRKKIIATIHLYYGEPLEDEAKEMIAWLEKQGEQKPTEWSEKDEDTLHCIIDALDSLDIRTNTNGEHEDHTEEIYWLKSLKDRVQPQPQQEWSEEDEENFKGVMDALNFCNHEGVNPYDIDPLYLASWLKSLRPQSTWKPTEQQMKVLNEVINFAADHGTMRWNDYIYNVLKGLREQLKKL